MTAKTKKEKKSILLENTFLPFGVEMLFSWFIIVLFTMYLHLQTRSCHSTQNTRLSFLFAALGISPSTYPTAQ